MNYAAANPLPAMSRVVELTELSANLFRGQCHAAFPGTAFGGQMAAQALAAAGRTVQEGSEPHSLHGYFIRAADAERPITYMVEQTRDGRSFSTRQVTAGQHGRTIFTLMASFHRGEDGPSYGPPMPDMPLPSDVPSPAELAMLAGGLAGDIWRMQQTPSQVLDVRVVPQPMIATPAGEDRRLFWVRVRDRLQEEHLAHASMLTYISDINIANTAGRRTPGERRIAASLDHAVWFHRRFRADEWLLYVLRNETVAAGRGLARGEFYTLEGDLAASVMQEALVRELHTDSNPSA
ncbi:acyl-CoA thioesterase [Nocardia sp. CA-084685]|uniref:acyl-CoA thioesterase n=1 Tax=Nocardia sp. CA-084685 TaxID=3239970 RepID=UPI003D963AC4